MTLASPLCHISLMSYRALAIVSLGLIACIPSCTGEEDDDLQHNAASAPGDGEGGARDPVAGDGDGDGDQDKALPAWCRDPATTYNWHACENPTPMAAPASVPSWQRGYVQCDDGTINRLTAEPVVPLGGIGGLGGGGALGPEIGCESDQDCEADQACVSSQVSGGNRTECVPAGCRSAADCDTGECSVYRGVVVEEVTLACRQTNDPCRTRFDCPCNVEDEAALQCLIGGSFDAPGIFACGDPT